MNHQRLSTFAPPMSSMDYLGISENQNSQGAVANTEQRKTFLTANESGAVSLALRPEEQRSDREVEKAYGKTGKQSKNQHRDGRWDF
jgi:hypothetical protein